MSQRTRILKQQISFHFSLPHAGYEMCMLWRRHADREGYWQISSVQVCRMWIERHKSKEEAGGENGGC